MIFFVATFLILSLSTNIIIYTSSHPTQNEFSLISPLFSSVRGVTRLYEGDPAPTTPFAELLDVETGEAIGKGGMMRLVPWEGSRSTSTADYLVVITDPRPKSVELRTGMKRLVGAMKADILKKCVIVNADTPSENRRFVKKNFEDSNKTELRIFSDENLEWMREYTALGEKVSFGFLVLVSYDVASVAILVSFALPSYIIFNLFYTPILPSGFQ